MDAKIYKRKLPIIPFLIPAFLFMAVFLFWPFLDNIIVSFQKVKGLATDPKLWKEGFYEVTRVNNLGKVEHGFLFNTRWYMEMVEEIWDYEKTFETHSFVWGHGNLLIALKNTGITILATLVCQVGLALILALLVSNIKKAAGAFRVVFFFPIIVSATALALLFQLIFMFDGGMINQIGHILGILKEEAKFDWKGTYPIFTMLTPVIWQYVGFYFVILLTGISGISEDLYEAASIDGASRIQRVRYITLPLLKNSISTCAVLAVTGALKVFDLPWVMFPNGASDTWLTGTYMYSKTMANNVSYAATISILIVVLGVLLSTIVNKLFKTDESLEM